MSKFTDSVKQETPRLVVTYSKIKDEEEFKWGIVGAMPPLSLLGAITRAQTELFTTAGEDCPEPAFVIAWEDTTRSTCWYIHATVPLEPLVGMLEMIKIMLGTSQIAQMSTQAARGPILGPDGRPVPRG